MRQRVDSPSAPVYAPNSLGGPVASPAAAAESPGWESDGELVRSAATLHAEDDDFSQARSMIRNVFDQAARQRFVATLAGQHAGLTRPEVQARFFEYWTAIDPLIASEVRAAA
jgi:catalase